MMRKLILTIFLAFALLLTARASTPAAAPADKAKQKFDDAYRKEKPEKFLRGTKLTATQFQYMAQAQIDVLSYMLCLYFRANGKFPKNLSDLMQSKLWICDFNDLITGEPIEPIQFIPTSGDFITPEQELGGGATPPNPEGQGGGPQAPPLPPRGTPQIVASSFRVNPESVPASPGGVYYYGTDNFFQVIVFFDHSVYKEAYQNGQYNFYSDNFAVRSETKSVQLDTPMLNEAVIVSQIVPRAYNALQFVSDKPTMRPDEMAALGVRTVLEEAKTLGIVPLNPYTGKHLAVSPSFAEGDVYTRDQGDGFPYYFCFTGGRLRTLDEMNDPKVYRAHQSEIASRR